MGRKLISMTDFVLEQIKIASIHHEDDSKCLDVIFRYARFLEQPLKLEMFVPTNDDGNVLKTSLDCNCNGHTEDCFGCSDNLPTAYSIAKEKVLFEGVKIISENSECVKIELPNKNVYTYIKKHNRFMYCYDYRIEKVIYADLTLTPIAIKQIGL